MCRRPATFHPAAAAALAAAHAAALVTGGCSHVLDNPAKLVWPWERPPEHFNWVISLGAAVAFFNDAPPGVDDVFLGLRLGLYIATAGEHHIDEDPESLVSTLGRMTYFRSGVPIIPDSIFVSPLGTVTGMDVYGVGFRPISIGIHPLGGVVRVGASTGLIATYAYLRSERAAWREVHFFQPGVDARADLELDWGGPVFFGLGFNSLFHLPQRLGPALAGGPPVRLWHIGQGFLLVNIRLPNEADP